MAKGCMLEHRRDRRVAQLVEEVRLPVVAPAGGEEVVERTLRLDVGAGLAHVRERGPELAQGRQRWVGVLRRAGVEARHEHNRLAVQLLGNVGQGWNAPQPDLRRELVRRLRRVLPPGPQHALGVLVRVEDERARYLGAERVELELERGHDAEPASAASQRPEEVGVLVAARAAKLPVGVAISTERRLSQLRP
jgi:hypothetical protein